MADEKIKIDFELSGVDRAKVQVAEFEKGLTSAQKAVVALAKADEATGKSLKALEEGLAAGTVSAEEYVAALKAIADQAPKTAAQVKAAKAAEERASKAAADAERKAADDAAKAEAKKLAQLDKLAAAAEKAAQRVAAARARETEAAQKAADAAKAAAEEEALADLAAAAAAEEAAERKAAAERKRIDDVRRANEAAARDARATRPGVAESLEARGITAGGLAAAAGTTVAATAAFAAATLAAGNALATAAARAERHDRAVHALGNTYRLVQAATNDTISAEDAYRAQLDLTRSGLRVSGEEFALITRYAREHKGAMESNEEALQQLTEALRNGEAEGLRKFGLSTQQGATRAQQFERALRQMDRATKDVTPAQRTMAEEQERLSRTMGDGADAFGRLAAHALGLPETMAQVADSIRDVVTVVNDLVDAEQRLPAERARQERRTRAQQSYGQALRAVGGQLDALGVDRSLLPAADAANRLTPEQLEAADARLRALAGRIGNRDAAGAAGFGAGARFVPGRARSTGEQADFAGLTRAPTTADLDAEARALEANLRGRRSDRRGGALTRAAGARAEAEQALRDLAAQLAREAAANTATPTTRPGPRDTAPTASGNPNKNILGILMAQAAGEGQQGVGTGTVAQELRRLGVIGDPERNPDLGANLYAGPARRPGGGQGAAGDAVDEAMAAQAQARSRRQLEQQLDAQLTYTERMRDLHGERISLAQQEAEAVTMGFNAMGRALGQHVNAVVGGQESIAVGLQAMLSDTLTAIGTEAIVKGAMQMAEGAAALAGIITAPLAPGHFAAGAAFVGVGALVASLGGAIAPSASGAAPSSGGSAPAMPSAPVGATAAASNDNARGGPTEITINLGGGVVLGSARELGEALGRVVNDPSAGVSINANRVRRAGGMR